MHLYKELKRRNVFRAGLAYLVAAWLVAQVVELAAETFAAPAWIMQLLIVVLVLGFPAVVIFAWAYEITPEGLKRESEVERSDFETYKTARRLDIVTIALVVALAGVTLVDRHYFRAPDAIDSEPEAAQSDTDPAQEDAAASTDRSIAVLPFVNMSDDPENEYFADGLAEEILNRLAQIPELRVAGRTSSFQYKDRNEDLRDIARELNVAHVLEGSVRRSGDQVRITAQLIHARDGSHLWSQTYDHTLEDVFRTQDEIAENVAVNLNVVMDDQLRERMRRVGVRNVDAFVAYQKAWQRFVDAHDEDDPLKGLREANQGFRRVTELYPAFGDAWYWQADLYQHILLDDTSTREDLKVAEAETQRLLMAAVEHARTPQQRAFSNVTRAVFSDDWSNIRTLLDRAWEAQTCVGPNWSELPSAFGLYEQVLQEILQYRECLGGFQSSLGYLRLHEGLMQTGRIEEALASADEAIVQLGQSSVTSRMRIQALMALGQWEEAVREAELIGPESRLDGQMVAVTLAAAGRMEEANRAAETWLSVPDIQSHDRMQLYAALGWADESRALAATLDARPAGHLKLASAVLGCLCGAPFDIAATPNLNARIEEAGLEWPPVEPIKLRANPFTGTADN